MSRRTTRQLLIIVGLLAVLAMIGAAYWNYTTTRRLGIDFEFNQSEMLTPPQYLYSFSGDGDERLERPLGVLVDGGRVYVTDSRRGVVDVFNLQGAHVATWGKDVLETPLYLAKHPVTQELYVSDRRTRSIEIFGKDGSHVGRFEPNLPDDQLPAFDTGEDVWAPVAFDFADDGSMYVAEILNGHRLLVFSPEGEFKRSVGAAGLVQTANTGEGLFQFPNSVKVFDDRVWVSDSNNRRVQVFDLDGEFDRLVVTQGLPRGFDFLPREEGEPARLVVIDTLSHDATIWDATRGSKLLTFGARGVLDGQFSYPNDASIDAQRRIFIADTANGRIQVWGWPAMTNPVQLPTSPLGWIACLAPLLLIPVLLLMRKRRYLVTRDFVHAVVDAGAVEALQSKRRVRWEILEFEHEAIADLEVDGVQLGTLIRPVQFSESDAAELESRFELARPSAAILSAAGRSDRFYTENAELRRIAKVMDVRVAGSEEFLASSADSAMEPAEESGE